MDLREHVAVEDVLGKLNADRKCWRLVGGILTERTVGEVLPAIASNKGNLEAALKSLNEQLEDKAKETSAFKARHNIKTRGEFEREQAEAGKAGNKGNKGGNKGAQGVLAGKS